MADTTDSKTPYANAPSRSFWRSGVLQGDGAGLSEMYAPKVRITQRTRVATAGSCFAQHIGRWLDRAGISLLDAEPAPAVMPDAVAHRFGYRLFSGRYGNIYTTRQMLQLLEDIIEARVDPRFVWDGPKSGYVDAFRPTVEPEGIKSIDEVLLHRDYHLERTAQMLREADVFVFTLGLAEAWEDSATGRVFPLCPGVSGGTFDADLHRLRLFRYGDVIDDLHRIRSLLHRFNPAMEMLLTVSPVPLTATATGDHVLVATTQAKSTLRAAAGDFAADIEGVDYFPSFELVTSHATGGPWFNPNQRTVAEAGVERVMTTFLTAQGLAPADPEAEPRSAPQDAFIDPDEDLVCDELLLEAAR